MEVIRNLDLQQENGQKDTATIIEQRTVKEGTGEDWNLKGKKKKKELIQDQIFQMHLDVSQLCTVKNASRRLKSV